jgi:iron complex outermembrane receptor protein
LFIFGESEESQGIEVDLSYNPQPNWQIMFGYTHATKAETVASTNAARVGLPLAAFPDHVLSVWTKYDINTGVLRGWSVGGGLRDSGSARFVADPNLVATMEPYTTVDFLLQYRFKLGGRDTLAQFNLKNAFDAEYREGNMGGWGDPQNLMFSLSTKF